MMIGRKVEGCVGMVMDMLVDEVLMSLVEFNLELLTGKRDMGTGPDSWNPLD
jgi:hypothetical protein